MGREAKSFHVKVAVRVRPLMVHDREQKSVVEARPRRRRKGGRHGVPSPNP
jgi:hypothetical protein